MTCHICTRKNMKMSSRCDLCKEKFCEYCGEYRWVYLYKDYGSSPDIADRLNIGFNMCYKCVRRLDFKIEPKILRKHFKKYLNNLISLSELKAVEK